MEKRIFKYQIGEKTFIQKPLVLGQIDQLMNLIKGLKIPNTYSPWAIKEALGDKLTGAFAIVLVEEGKSPRRSADELQALAEEISFGIEVETLLKVIEDFFVCNPIASLLEKLAGTMTKLSDEFLKMRTGSKTLSSSSRAATSPGETTSSGDTPPESASPSPITDTGK